MQIGLVVRVYAKDVSGVAEAVDRTLSTLRVATQLRDESNKNRLRISSSLVVVAKDLDCGKTATAIEWAIHDEHLRVVLVDSCRGDNSREVLNHALEHFHRLKYTHMLVMSNKALPLLTNENVDRCVREVRRGAKVVGVQNDEQARTHDRVENTFALWDIDALQKVGGFDSSIGVEEIAPMIRMYRQSPWYNFWTSRRFWLVFNPDDARVVIRSDGEKRFNELRESKIRRQENEAKRLHSNLAELERGRMTPSKPDPAPLYWGSTIPERSR